MSFMNFGLFICIFFLEVALTLHPVEDCDVLLPADSYLEGDLF